MPNERINLAPSAALVKSLATSRTTSIAWYRHESFTLVRGNKPLAELRPLPQGKAAF